MAGELDAAAGVPPYPLPTGVDGPLLRRARARAAAARAWPSGAALALALYVFCAASRVFELVPQLRLGFVVGGLVIAGTLLLPPQRRLAGLAASPVGPVVGILVLSVVTLPVSSWPTGTLQHVLNTQIKLVLVALLIVYAIRTLGDLRAVLCGYLGAALWLELHALLFSTRGYAQVTVMYDRNDLAFVLCVTLPVAAYCARSLRDPLSWLAWAVGGLAIPVILATRSRGGFLTMMAIGGLLLFRLGRWRPVLAALALTGALIGVVVLAPDGYWQRISTAWSSGDQPRSYDDYDAGGWVTARKHLWIAGLELMLEHPLLGTGAGVFGQAVHDESGRMYYRAAHNSFLEIAGELGVGGVSLFVLMLLRSVRASRAVAALGAPAHAELPRLAAGIEVSIYAYAIGGFALSQAYWLPLYVTVGLAAVLPRIAGLRPAAHLAPRRRLSARGGR